MITLKLPYPISSNRYWETRVIRVKATGKWTAMTYVSAEAKAYKEHVSWLAKAAGVKLLDCSVAMGYVLHPKLTVKGEASKTILDLSNAIKVTEDALNGIAYLDDKQVKEIRASIGEPVKDGAITVTITPIVVVAAQAGLI